MTPKPVDALRLAPEFNPGSHRSEACLWGQYDHGKNTSDQK